MNVKIDSSWKEVLNKEFCSAWFDELASFVRDEYASERTIYPLAKNIFKAFDTTPFEQVKVVILGQDPYHGPNQAQGLSFSVPSNVPNPPSLVNIFKELASDFGSKAEAEAKYNGDLTNWANQGVLLLNTSLTVEANRAASHSGKGWERLTDAAIKALSERRESIVFMLWGSHARSKKSLIDYSKHLILEAPHPSPLSAYRGFFGCRHFSKANQYLREHTIKQINW